MRLAHSANVYGNLPHPEFTSISIAVASREDLFVQLVEGVVALLANRVPTLMRAGHREFHEDFFRRYIAE